MLNEQSDILDRIKVNTEMIITKEQKVEFKNAINCHICDKE